MCTTRRLYSIVQCTKDLQKRIQTHLELSMLLKRRASALVSDGVLKKVGCD